MTLHTMFLPSLLLIHLTTDDDDYKSVDACNLDNHLERHQGIGRRIVLTGTVICKTKFKQAESCTRKNLGYNNGLTLPFSRWRIY